MHFSLLDLPWLVPAPADFSARCRAFGRGEGTLGGEGQRLAGFALDNRLAGALSRAIGKRLPDSDPGEDGLARFRLGVVASGTADLLIDCLPAAALRHGVALTVENAPYDQVLQQALDPSSQINRAALDGVLLRVDHRWLSLDRPRLGGDEAEVVAQAIGRVRDAVEGFAASSGAALILETAPVPPIALFGSFDRLAAGSVRRLVARYNDALVELVAEKGLLLLDTAALAERVGTEQWFDPAAWNAYKLPFTPRANLAYADLLGRLIGAVRGKARKCLVLDLDNTLWGGVIGDDGLAGIKIGQGSAVGEAHLAVQQLAYDLRERGVILAVSSKNEDETARGPFREHADMVLREEHVSVFQANWLDKASNLEAIAKQLNIGLDALVFLDDNPAERAQLRAALPMVAIPELPIDPALFPTYLAAAGYFEAISFTDDDRKRIQTYASNAQRAAVQSQFRDLGDYLRALDMVMTAAPFDEQNRARITQLANKTNQFNLTTRRYTEKEIEAFERAADTFTLQVRLTDRFGDFGMIAEIVARPNGEDATWEIDTWLMSCRVLGRKVEEAMLGELVAAARAAGVSRLVGVYRPTPKNAMVADHYPKLGFAPAATSESGEATFVLDVDAYVAPALPMRVSRPDAAPAAIAAE